MMKTSVRVSFMIVVAMVTLTLLLAAPVFADVGTLNFIKSTPKSGASNVPIDNVGVKLFFDGDVTNESVWAANSKCFTLTDPDGKVVDSLAYAGEKPGEQGYILVIAKPTPAKEGQPGQLMQKSSYLLTVSGDLSSATGAKLGEDIKIGFTTMDLAANSRLSMIIMVVMMVAVIALMFLNNWRKMRAEAEAAALLKANPYRIAKEKSISIDEARALIDKAKEKNQKQLDKVGGKAPAPEEKKSVAPRLESKKKGKKTHRVSGPRPVSEGGSKFKSGRKAEKERKARVEAARKAAAGQAKTGSGAKKSSKNKGKKK